MQLNLADSLWDELLKITKLYTHAKSAKKIGSKEEAEAFYAKADKLMIQWGRKLRIK